MSFAAIETRINAFALARLANVEATIGGVPGIPGIFDTDWQDAFDLVSGRATALLVAGDVVVAKEMAVVVPAGSYKVDDIKPENGLQRLILRKAT